MICDVCERHEEDTNMEIVYTRFGTWECNGPGSCYEQSLRLEYGEDKYPFGGGTPDPLRLKYGEDTYNLHLIDI